MGFDLSLIIKGIVRTFMLSESTKPVVYVFIQPKENKKICKNYRFFLHTIDIIIKNYNAFFYFKKYFKI